MDALTDLFKSVTLALVRNLYISAFSLSSYLHVPVYFTSNNQRLLAAPTVIYFFEYYKVLKPEKLVLVWNNYISPNITQQQFCVLLDHFNYTYYTDPTGIFVNARSNST